jgi:hypothetical protein
LCSQVWRPNSVLWVAGARHTSGRLHPTEPRRGAQSRATSPLAVTRVTIRSRRGNRNAPRTSPRRGVRDRPRSVRRPRPISRITRRAGSTAGPSKTLSARSDATPIRSSATWPSTRSPSSTSALSCEPPSRPAAPKRRAGQE